MKLEEAVSAPMDGDPMFWLWNLAAAAKGKKKVPADFEDAAIAGLARAAVALGEPKNGWGIGFARVAEVGAQLLVVHPSERLAKGVLGLAALSGIGGDVVKSVRRSKSKAVAKALAEHDRREKKATTYAAMRKAMDGYVDEVFPRNAKRAAPKPPVDHLRFANGKVLARSNDGAWNAYRKALRATTGPKGKRDDERRALTPKDVTPKERKQLVGILAHAFGLRASFDFDDIVSGTSDEELIAETAQTPIEWWDIVDDKKKVRYQLWTYHADCGSLVLPGTSKRVAAIIQFGFGVEVKDPDHRLARAMEAAHADLRKRCPKSELAGMDFSVDD
jgi:hypothetical protein